MATDWALAVGVGKYPDRDFPRLDGPETDARDFYAWVTSKSGGAVPKKRAKLIVSPKTAPKSVIGAKPAAEQVEEFFEHLDETAQRRRTKTAGRRLYLYFSGHGFAPDESEVALLMANAAQKKLKHHVPGKAWANLFYRSGYFEEVLLFMDCCRSILKRIRPNEPSVQVQDNPQAIQQGRRLFVFATKWGAESRERVFENGKPRGVFTMALMDGLRGRACEPGTKTVTAMSLRSYLYNNMKYYFGEDDQHSPNIPKEPEIEPPQSTANFTIATVPHPPQGTMVRILLPARLKGKTVNIRGNSTFQIIASRKANQTQWKRELPRGLYLAEVVGGPVAKPFEVKGIGKETVNVDFR